MNWDPDDSELLERYAQGELTEAEAEALENRIASDPAFAREAALTIEALAGIKTHAQQKEKEKVKAIWDEVKKEQNGNAFAKQGGKRMAMAASVLLICAIGTFFLFQNFQSSNQKAFNQYFSPLAPLPKTRQDPPELITGMQLYQQGDYPAAEKEFQTQLPLFSNKALVYTYLGNTALGQENGQKAIEYLKKAGKGPTEGMESHIDWYLALAHLLVEEEDKALALLTQIATNSGPYSQKAQDLLKSLKQ